MDATREHFQAILRADAAPVAIGILLIAVGISAIVLFRVEHRRVDKTLLWFGVFAALYGVRLLIISDTVRLTIGIQEATASRIEALITYGIILPCILFLREFFPTWRPVLRWLLYLQSAFAVTGVIADAVLDRPLSLSTVNNALVLTGIVALLISLYRVSARTPGIRSLRAGMLIFAITIVIANLSSLRILALPLNVEPFGFAVFLGTVAHVLASRAFDSRERLQFLSKELEIARRIQMSILPRTLPATPQLKLAARYVPMREVGGDFYDFLRVDEHRLGMLIADVSGHGIPAALIASMVQVAVASQVPHAHDPALVLAGMNQALCGKLKGQFVTAAYLFLDLTEGTLRYAAAGHPPVLWQRHQAGIERLVSNGLALGFRASTRYTTITRALQPGDRFLLYTDGLIEAHNPSKEQYGEERVSSILADDKPLEAVAGALLESVSRWAGDDPEDDVTFVLVECAPPIP